MKIFAGGEGGTTIIIESGNPPELMTALAAPRVQKDPAGKRVAGKKESGKKPALDAMAEYSHSGFLENEPDLYSVSDIKMRYR